MNFLLFTGNRAGGAIARTDHAAGTRIENAIVYQFFAHLRRTAFLFDVRFVLVAEMLDRRENGMRRTLSQTAQTARQNIFGQALQLFDVAFLTLARADALQDFENASRPDTTRHTLAAAFVLDEIHKEPCDIDHAGTFVHYDQAT